MCLIDLNVGSRPSIPVIELIIRSFFFLKILLKLSKLLKIFILEFLIFNLAFLKDAKSLIIIFLTLNSFVDLKLY